MEYFIPFDVFLKKKKKLEKRKDKEFKALWGYFPVSFFSPL